MEQKNQRRRRRKKKTIEEDKKEIELIGGMTKKIDEEMTKIPDQ